MANKPSALPRAEQMKRAAEFRTAILAFVVNRDSPPTREEINQALLDKMSELGYTSINLDYFLRSMTDGNTPLMRKIENPSGQTVYGPPGVHTKKSKEPKHAKRHVGVSMPETPTLIVDVVKETGRVRITTKGLIIEIGVIE